MFGKLAQAACYCSALGLWEGIQRASWRRQPLVWPQDACPQRWGQGVLGRSLGSVICFESALFSLCHMSCTFVQEQPLGHLLRDRGLGDGGPRHLFWAKVPAACLIKFSQHSVGNIFIYVLCMCVLSYPVMSNSCATSWTVAYQVPLSMGFSRQEY